MLLVCCRLGWVGLDDLLFSNDGASPHANNKAASLDVKHEHFNPHEG